jgi:hypothetical protein
MKMNRGYDICGKRNFKLEGESISSFIFLRFVFLLFYCSSVGNHIMSICQPTVIHGKDMVCENSVLERKKFSS